MKNLLLSLLVASTLLTSPALGKEGGDSSPALSAPIDLAMAGESYYARRKIVGANAAASAPQANWETTPWLVSVPCSGGVHTETRKATCVKSGDTVADTECTAAKPVLSQTTACTALQNCKNSMGATSTRPSGISGTLIYDGYGGLPGGGIPQWVQKLWDVCSGQPALPNQTNRLWCTGNVTLQTDGAYRLRVYTYTLPWSTNPSVVSDSTSRNYFCL